MCGITLRRSATDHADDVVEDKDDEEEVVVVEEEGEEEEGMFFPTASSASAWTKVSDMMGSESATWPTFIWRRAALQNWTQITEESDPTAIRVWSGDRVGKCVSRVPSSIRDEADAEVGL